MLWSKLCLTSHLDVPQQVRHPTARVEHEASTSKIGEDQLFYFQQRGIPMEEAVAMIISGTVVVFCISCCRDIRASSVDACMRITLQGLGLCSLCRWLQKSCCV
jgi:SUF system FeS cluster assembly, SufBD